MLDVVRRQDRWLKYKTKTLRKESFDCSSRSKGGLKNRSSASVRSKRSFGDAQNVTQPKISEAAE
jgi:hypothetical protein